MLTELSRDETVADEVDLKTPTEAGSRDRIIDIISNELLGSGRSVAEILHEVKRLTDEPNKRSATFGVPTPSELGDPRADPDFPASIARSGFVQRVFLPLRRAVLAFGVVLLSLVTIVGSIQLVPAHQRIADHQNEAHLLQQLRERGQLISKSLRPALDNAELKNIRQLGVALRTRAGGAQSISLLFAPGGGDSFYYTASWPNDGEDFKAQRHRLVQLGVLERLTASCRDAAPFELLDPPTTAGNEGIAVSPLWTPAGCWVVVSSFAIGSRPAPNTANF